MIILFLILKYNDNQIQLVHYMNIQIIFNISNIVLCGRRGTRTPRALAPDLQSGPLPITVYLPICRPSLTRVILFSSTYLHLNLIVNDQNIVNLHTKQSCQNHQVVDGWQGDALLPLVYGLWCAKAEDVLQVLYGKIRLLA